MYTAIAKRLALDQLPEAQLQMTGGRVRAEERSRRQVALTGAWAYLGLLELFNVGKDTVTTYNGTFNRSIADMNPPQAEAWITASQGAVTGLYQQLIRPLESPSSGEDSESRLLTPLLPLIAVSALGVLQRVKQPGLPQIEARTRAHQAILELKEQGDDRAYRVVEHYPDKFQLPRAA